MAKENKIIPGKFEMYCGEIREVINPLKTGYWRFHKYHSTEESEIKMTDKKDLPAFPHQKKDGSPYWGMTIRDYFAAHADIPWNAVIETYEINYKKKNPTVSEIVSYRSELKYLEADAMLAARDK